jgi:hypothetical protein
MHCLVGILLAACLTLSGCATGTPRAPLAVAQPPGPIDYLQEVQPILNKRCVVCHSGPDSPCQLEMGSFAGLARGAGRSAAVSADPETKVADPAPLLAAGHPARVLREKRFVSVIASDAAAGFNNSLLLQLLAQKKKHPVGRGDSPDAAGDLTCAANGSELAAFVARHPDRGMPFGLPPVSQEEYQVIAGWLATGAQGPVQEEEAALAAIPGQDLEKLSSCEEFLNRADAKHAMTARYLYEHLFLAHITFSPGSRVYFELIRSRTPSGVPIEVIPSVRPYDDPGDTFFYRFRRLKGTTTDKNHIVMELGAEQLKRAHDLFIRPDWLMQPHRVGYDPELSANPFAVFEQIPPRARYQFLLDNALPVVMTVFQGPAGTEKAALNVINDHFWLMFLDPDHDLSIRLPGFLREVEDLLRMPSEPVYPNGQSRAALLQQYRRTAATFSGKRRLLYDIYYRYQGRGYEAIWRGNRADDAPLLTVFRHADSASVHKGALGDLAKTMWVIDYPLLERLYYSQVAGFAVSGPAGGRQATRIYMDELRQEGETQFLDFLPQDQRRDSMQYWYGGMELNKLDYFPSALPAKISFSTGDAKREFIEHLVHHHFLAETGIVFDDNYLEDGEHHPGLPREYTTIEEYLQGLRAVLAPGGPFFSHADNRAINLAYIRIRVPDGQDAILSMVIHRWHDDVTTLRQQERHLDAAKDRADIFAGFIGASPDYFFTVDLKDLPDFLEVLQAFDASPQSIKRLGQYEVDGSEARFWEVGDWFQDRYNESGPERSGVFALNRYAHRNR